MNLRNVMSVATLLLSGCEMTPERFEEALARQECRILGPDCIGDYLSVSECLGDVGYGDAQNVGLDFSSESARQCIAEMKDICPDDIFAFNRPESCLDVYANAFE